MKINHDKFISACGGDKLKQDQKDGLLALIGFIEADTDITDIRWTAYMLATVNRECAGTWQPITEYGKGKGRPYGLLDAKTGFVYYGRGYVQLTWAKNYQSIGEKLGVDLYLNPQLALQPDIAYKIMSFGMRHGSFTGVGLAKYINDQVCDYINARRIINGIDSAAEIAKAAEWFEGVLKDCEVKT